MTFDVYIKSNIYDYLARPEASKKQGGEIYWGYLLKAADGF